MGLDTRALNAAVLASLGEVGGVVFHVKDHASPPSDVVTDVAADAGYRGPWEGTSVLGVQIAQTDLQLLLPTEDILNADDTVRFKGLSSIGAEEGDTVTARGKLLTIVDIQPDDGGMSLVTVKGFTS